MDSDPPEAAAAGWEVELSVLGGATTVAGVDAGVVGGSEGVSAGAWGWAASLVDLEMGTSL